ncbi:post-GPI attachment to proteins factor 3-like [Branchiostoma floridae]|uniref:Post-GPI attachment to proteins factor 3 n=1 Tax=Branchiostoma floridae TaxID=7739 RepID=A0A9J7N1V1_BRAFL|nr:post-GPI attachment to proteins factor 3-like [Branchiostoma floridae]
MVELELGLPAENARPSGIALSPLVPPRILCFLGRQIQTLPEMSVQLLEEQLHRAESGEGGVKHTHRPTALYMSLLGWWCEEECKYGCMWRTVEQIQAEPRGEVPQFYGKWPFVRVLGIQEPASVLFSILNGLGHVVMIGVFRRRVPSHAKMNSVVHWLAVISINAWFWSAVFHTRDFSWTEKMDYFCATSLVVFQLFMWFTRFGGFKESAMFGALLAALFSGHVYYLGFVKFDYGYNMMANVAVGQLNAFCWLGFAFKNVRQRRYMWKCIATILSINLLLLLELGDFPPIWWTFDAHSLWHAGTAPVVPLWYSFLIDENLYLLREAEEKDV